jgi:membrane protein implicated in regulation of membrane protease activity
MAGLGSGDGDGGDGDAEALGDGHDASHSLESGHADTAHGHHHGHHGADGGMGALGAAASVLFSLQLWTYLLAFGGVTGLLLRWLAHVGEPVAGLCALTVGLGTGFAARKVLRRMTAIGDGGTVEQEKLIGTSAQVLIPAEAGRTGKIRLSARGHTLDLMARASDGKALAAGVEVIIVDMKEGIAEVTTEMPELPAAQDSNRNALGARSAVPEVPPSTKG